MAQDNENENQKAGYAYAAGIALFATVVSCTAAGWFLDKWFGIGPWGLIGGIILGSAAGLFEFVRLSQKTY